MRPEDRRYASSHEWAKQDGDTILIGITDFAIDELCNGNIDDLVYCDLPEVGRQVDAGETFGEIESVKAVSDLMAPITGEVVERNEAVLGDLEILKKDAFGEGWMLKVKMEKPDEFASCLDDGQYQSVVDSEDH